MSSRFISTIDLGNGADLEVAAGDIFGLDFFERPEYIFQNNHAIKIGQVKDLNQLITSANDLSTYLKERAISFYRGYKFPKSFQDWQKRERLHPSIATLIWEHYSKGKSE